jgi:hypothetical protein
MVGDDVVDLADPEARAVHPRFDARVFGAAERRLLAASPQPECLRWVLWAAKEAAYKLAVKHGARASFSPVRFAVELATGAGPAWSGRVLGAGRVCSVRVRRAGDALHALAEAGGASAFWGLARRADGEDPSRAARALAARELARRVGAPPEAVRFSRRGRVPVVWVEDRDLRADVSLSHHGRLVAFACQLAGGGA